MSWEAWGTPPDEEQELCPICDNSQHTPDKCEIAAHEERTRKHYEGAIALILQDRERRLTEAYAEGRKDEAEATQVTLNTIRTALAKISKTEPTAGLTVAGENAWLVHVIALDALSALPPCKHAWEMVQYGATYHDLKCAMCGEVKRETWD